MLFAPTIRPVATVPALGLLDTAFERFMHDASGSQRAPWHSLEEDAQSWSLCVDLPGVAKEHLSLSIEGPLVRIETRPESRRQYRASWQMPQDVDADATQARLENGVLSLKLAKLVPPSKMRQIAIG